MFQFEVTEDGSYSLRLGDAAERSEAMHSLRGAFSETVYIYGSAVDFALENGFVPKFLSVGLGLGYVEILSAGLILKFANRLSENEKRGLLNSIGGESFEANAELRDWFLAWTQGCEDQPPPEDFVRAYEDALARTSQHVGLPAEEIRNFLKWLIDTRRWQIRGKLTPESSFGGKFGCICFDAFSSKTSPELWSEDFLQGFLKCACAESSVISTYACTGALKRSLRSCGFELRIREGFSSKRDSTFAIRLPHFETKSS